MSIEAWADAALAAAVFALDPQGCGVRLRASPGPARDRWLTAAEAAFGDRPWRRLPLNIGDERLLGGLDLAATLSAGRPIYDAGLLVEAQGGAVVAAMAERLAPETAAKIAGRIDGGDGFGLILLDEGRDDDEAPPAALTDRMGVFVALDGLRVDDAPAFFDAAAIARAAERTPRTTDQDVAALAASAAALGVDSLRAPLAALRVARAAAALDGADDVGPDHLAAAARLVLAPRATRAPAPPEQDDAPPEPPQDAAVDHDDSPKPEGGPLADQVLDAALAALPPGLLEALSAGGPAARRSTAGGRGARRRAQTRGRRIGAVRGALGRGRLDLLATIRAAAPMRRLRAGPDDRRRLIATPDDVRLARFKDRAETLTIFAVDASGSTAAQRLAEAKGAVELLLADCYARRDQVALIAFRRMRAELILPPTRSLARAKRELAALPGGGGTPLAAGVAATAALADAAVRRGATPLAVFLTDGGANIRSDGAVDRRGAVEEAAQAARALAAGGTRSLVLDVSARPRPAAADFAAALGGRYAPLPRADAAALNRAVRAAR